ncbi:MAG: acyltransferase family protein, partial [Herbiconiux sp.]|nr:acyltransferase family protein [Herbiconiux sp.]
MLSNGPPDVRVSAGGRGPGFFGLLDQLRGVAALLVVWAHLVGYFLEASGRSWLPFSAVDRFVEAPLAIVESFGWFGVALFFFISGFVITHAASRETGREFIVKRLLRIYPPLVVAVLLALALSGLNDTVAVRGDGGALTGWDVAANLTLVNYVVSPRAVILVVAWTLAVEMTFYLIMWAARGLIARRALLLSPVVLAVVVLVLVTSPVHESIRFGLITVGMVPLLVIGQLCYLVAMQRVGLRFGVVGAFAAWLVWILSMERIYPDNLVPESSYPVNALYALLLFVIAVLA